MGILSLPAEDGMREASLRFGIGVGCDGNASEMTSEYHTLRSGKNW